FGFELRLACPEGYQPDRAILERAQENARIVLTTDPAEAVEGADVVNTDVWASMGQEEEAEQRKRAFEGYHVDDALMARASERAIFLHCLPAHRGEEVSESVIAGRQSRVFDEAENRLHVQKAIMARLMGECSRRYVAGAALVACCAGRHFRVPVGGRMYTIDTGGARPSQDEETMAERLKRTPLYEEHVRAGAKMVPFAGYEMPVQYPTGIIQEHKAVRERAGLFDVSHMGELEIRGGDALGLVQYVSTNDASKLAVGQAQ